MINWIASDVKSYILVMTSSQFRESKSIGISSVLWPPRWTVSSSADANFVSQLPRAAIHPRGNVDRDNVLWDRKRKRERNKEVDRPAEGETEERGSEPAGEVSRGARVIYRCSAHRRWVCSRPALLCISSRRVRARVSRSSPWRYEQEG